MSDGSKTFCSARRVCREKEKFSPHIDPQNFRVMFFEVSANTSNSFTSTFLFKFLNYRQNDDDGDLSYISNQELD